MRNYIYRQLDKHRRISDDELYRMVIMLFVAAATIAVYFVLAVFYGFYCLPLSISHSIAVFVIALIVVLIGKRRADIACIMMGSVIFLSSMITIHTVGRASYAVLYQYFVLVIMILIPYKSKAVTVISAVVIPLLIVASHVYSIFTTPLYDLGGVITAVVIINIVASALGVLLLILMQQLVKNIIDSYNTNKLKELQAQAYIDPLTSLYNRRYAEIFLSTLAPDSGRAAFVAIADIDDFKLINDSHGHDTGDVVLKIIAKILKDNTKTGNPVFRWGGEEFMSIVFDMTEIEAAECMEMARRLIQDTPMIVGKLVLRPTVTIGMARLDTGRFDESFAVADKNLYIGKTGGKNRLVISPDRETES